MVEAALADHPGAYIACSGGKDSMVLAHLVGTVKDDVPVIHSTNGAPWAVMPKQWPRVLVKALESMGLLDVRVDRRNLLRSSAHMRDDGWDLVFVGLRRGESLRRRERMETRPQLAALPECWPLEDWTTDDVWRYIDECQVPYASLYDLAGRSSRMHWPDNDATILAWAGIRYVGVEPAPDMRPVGSVRWARPDQRWDNLRIGDQWVVVGTLEQLAPGNLVTVTSRAGRSETVRVEYPVRPLSTLTVTEVLMTAVFDGAEGATDLVRREMRVGRGPRVYAVVARATEYRCPHCGGVRPGYWSGSRSDVLPPCPCLVTA
jgi:3'-phosphoadenosine 5'-phosphosulfate sulfotransferase (PAPS reductase)/FAD synthetase